MNNREMKDIIQEGYIRARRKSFGLFGGREICYSHQLLLRLFGPAAYSTNLQVTNHRHNLTRQKRKLEKILVAMQAFLTLQ
jgi:hypothetical protein